MSIESVLRAAMPGVTQEHLASTVDAVHAELHIEKVSTQALLAPYEPEHVVHVGDVWGHSGRRYMVTHALEDGWVVLNREGELNNHTWVRVDDLTRERSQWRLLERGGEPLPPAPEQEPAREAGVEPATDEDIAYYAAHPGPLSAQRVGELVALVRQVERERDNALADLQAMSRGVGELLTERSQARLERDEAMTRADGEERARHQIEDERDALARRIDHVRTMCADAQVGGGYLRPDAVDAVLKGEA